MLVQYINSEYLVSKWWKGTGCYQMETRQDLARMEHGIIYIYIYI